MKENRIKRFNENSELNISDVMISFIDLIEFYEWVESMEKVNYPVSKKWRYNGDTWINLGTHEEKNWLEIYNLFKSQ